MGSFVYMGRRISAFFGIFSEKSISYTTDYRTLSRIVSLIWSHALKKKIAKMQTMQSFPACVVTGSRKFDHIKLRTVTTNKEVFLRGF